MNSLQPCVRCGVMIRSLTAGLYEGLCAPCDLGIRGELDDAKRMVERNRTAPPRSPYWPFLAGKVGREGYQSLSSVERLCFCVMVLEHRAYGGGIAGFLLHAHAEQ